MLTIRDARREDYEHYRRLMPELGVSDPVPPGDRWWSRQGATTRIAELDGNVLGYLFFEPIGTTFFVRNVVSDRGHRRCGIGRALMLDAKAIARERGATEWQLNVIDVNTPALALYRSLGFTTTRTTHVLRIAWDAAPSAEAARAIAPEEDGTIEQAFGMLPGLLALRRAAGRLLFACFAGETPVGAAVFDPTYPGAYPLFARDAQALYALLTEMREHRIPIEDAESPWRGDRVQLALEDSPIAAQAALDLGAELVFRVIGMRAALD